MQLPHRLILAGCLLVLGGVQRHDLPIRQDTQVRPQLHPGFCRSKMEAILFGYQLGRANVIATFQVERLKRA